MPKISRSRNLRIQEGRAPMKTVEVKLITELTILRGASDCFAKKTALTAVDVWNERKLYHQHEKWSGMEKRIPIRWLTRVMDLHIWKGFSCERLLKFVAIQQKFPEKTDRMSEAWPKSDFAGKPKNEKNKDTNIRCPRNSQEVGAQVSLPKLL